MIYSNLGNSGLLVSRLAFGAMTFGQGILVGELENRIDWSGFFTFPFLPNRSCRSPGSFSGVLC
jgi:hypothetical protein